MDRLTRLFTYTFITGAVAGLLEAFVLEHIFFRVKKYPIGNIREGKKVIKMLHLTDLHFKKDLSLKYRKLARRINKISPDIICISGDSIDKDGNTEPLERFLRLLDSYIPKVAILGNHEYASGVAPAFLKEVYKKVNCDLLVNESKSYTIQGTQIMFTGLDDILEGNENFARAVHDVGNEEHHFVLIHSPKHQEIIREEIKRLNKNRRKDDKLNIYGFFAGHNHGGQIKAGNYVPYLPPQSGDYVEGWYNKDKPYLYLSRGFGTSRIPIRFWSRSEVTLFTYYVK